MTSLTSKYQSTPTFTFKSAYKGQLLNESESSEQKRINRYPSAADYNPQKFHKFHKNVRFSKSIRKSLIVNKDQSESPGPGSYDVKMKVQSIKKKHVKSLSQRFNISKLVNPSPNQYKIVDLKKKAPIYSFPNKYPIQNDILLQQNSYKPGPAAYKLSNLIQAHSKQSIKIPKAKRQSICLNESNPGPATYNLNQSSFTNIKKQRKLPMSNRIKSFSLKNQSPGPADYNNTISFIDKNQKQQKGFLWEKDNKNKPMIQQKQHFPGPGTYQSPIEHKFRSASMYRIPKSNRSSLFISLQKQSSQKPGPGSHNPNDYQFSKSRVHKFSKANYNRNKITKQLNQSTSPTKYLNKKHIVLKSAPKISIGLSVRKNDCFINRNQLKIPGPQKYTPQSKLVTRSARESRIHPKGSRIPQITSNTTVGPAEYNPEIINYSPKIKFTKARRQFFTDKVIKNNSTLLIADYGNQRQQFPNAPKYMSVKSKLVYNPTKLSIIK